MTLPLPDPLLRAVLEFPDDDGPRLVCADWWEENGEAARGEFVRVQCEIAAHQQVGGPIPSPGRFEYLRRRERELLSGDCWVGWADLWAVARAFGCADFGPCYGRIADSTAPGGERHVPWEFRRGFVGRLACDAADWLTHADALMAAAPVRAVRLTTWPEVWRATADRGRPFGPDNHRLVFGPPRAGGEFATRIRPEFYSYEIRHLLAAEWPGVVFELPPAVAPDPNLFGAHAARRRGADPRPTAAPWEAPR